MTPISCFILTSPESPDARRESAIGQLAGMDLQHCLVDGFTRKSPEVSAFYSRWKNLLLAKRSMSNGEVATYLGHRLIWQKILDTGLPAALILEDDFRFRDPATARETIRTAFEEGARWDMIKLFDYQPRKSIANYERNGVTFVLRERPGSGLVGYVISRECCRRLLRRKSIFIPVDEELRCWFEHRISIVSVYPNVVEDGADLFSGSILEEHRQAMKRKRNILRSLWGNLLTLRLNIKSRLWRNRVLRHAGMRQS
ncbi:hypothetical protein E2A64_13700 [Pseudohoeflea suaedae]|uniref:Glycosyl transferase family 25 domain-containing protein n=1 Tax=Pseudohoeflea suaedae TaxID=877384 RepID=A0A4R5PIX3_9HYPH|nr:glycosyltransferase family 25 protein [Pseudohoeflea suaedae]TDH34804.1 hypothetical protein E2A64_13700 [Pseudohoeflea suaedae]